MDKIDWRLFKRVNLVLPISIFIRLEDGKLKECSGVTTNISYSGVYFKSAELKDITANDVLNISISIPREANRDFFFSRFVGKGRIVRIDEGLPSTSSTSTSGEKGIAFEFSPDITRLHAI